LINLRQPEFPAGRQPQDQLDRRPQVDLVAGRNNLVNELRREVEG